METTLNLTEDTKEIELDDSGIVKILYGELNTNLKDIENLYDIKVHSRGTKLVLKGKKENIEEADTLIHSVYELIKKGYVPDPGDLELASRVLKGKHDQPRRDISRHGLYIHQKKNHYTQER